MLRDLIVKLPWPVPPLHLVETRMSSPVSRKQRKFIEDKEFNIKLGRYTAEEDDIILNNWKTFCEIHKIDDDPLPFLSFEAKAESKMDKSAMSKYHRINFVRFLGHNLPNRQLNSIYSRFKKLFDTTIKGRFSACDDNTILNFMKTCNDANKFSKLSSILNRDRLAILKRYNVLMKRSM
ncbi:hypothetical protein FQA39_LY06313 [Lamprigera yunnana]|nr:hypothetical protein FQA39_LY06313 [Lamprigera yunnana]